MDHESVLTFWFGELQEGFADAFHQKRWYAFDPAFDRAIADQFGATLQQAGAGQLDHWRTEPRGRLAFILVTDQFSRQIHRGTGAAFATDPLAVEAAREGVKLGADRQLEYHERAFFYMPFEHSEALLDQHTGVALFTQLRDQTPQPHQHDTAESLRHAERHRDIIQRFGRFPHRNALLGRESTTAELGYLESSGDFGQAAV